MAGQYFTVTHNLNFSDVLVDITGKATVEGAVHQRLGLTGCLLGWNQTCGGSIWDTGRSVVSTNDGCYVIAGTTGSFGAGNYDVFLVKVNADGAVLWNKTCGGELSDYGFSMVQAVDGGYVLVGEAWSFYVGHGDMYIVKTDAEGEFGLVRTDTAANSVTLYRGVNDIYWNYVRVRVWTID